MQKLIVSAAMLLGAASAIACTGDTSGDESEDQVEQALINVPKGGIAPGVSKGPPSRRPVPTTQPLEDDPTQYVEERSQP